MRMTESWKNHLRSWKTYAAAAGATLAVSGSADASIIYSGIIDKTISVAPDQSGHTNAFTSIAIGATHARVAINEATNFFGYGRIGAADITGGPHLKFAVGSFDSLPFNSHAPVLKEFGAGQLIAATAFSAGGTQGLLLRGHGTHGPHGNLTAGPFGPGTVTGFIGFEIGNNNLKGWMEVKVADINSDGYAEEVEVISYAYNNTIGGAIDAGQTTPEPGTAALGLLASGAAGLLAWRRRKAKS
jgi:LPXTG-motif cell wall-anchored protein